MKRPLLIAACAASLAACATAPTYYQPAMGPDAIGFSEYRIENNRWRVTFKGGLGAPPAQVADFALLRAAELTLSQGQEWFQIVDRYAEQTRAGSSGPRLSIGAGTSSGSYGRWGGSGVGVGVGTSVPIGGAGSSGAHTQTFEIIMGRGLRPTGPDYYDARGIQSTIGAYMRGAPPAY